MSRIRKIKPIEWLIGEWKLGILIREGRVVNHRSLIKVFLNPFLRALGLQIETFFIGSEAFGISIHRCGRIKFSWPKRDDHHKYDFIVRKRILW